MLTFQRGVGRQVAVVGLLLGGVILGAACLSAAELTVAQAQAVDAAVAKYMEKEKVPGLSLALVVGGELCQQRGYGLADVENEVPATKDTVYRLASISKMLTAVAAMQLVEQSRLDLAAPVQKYLPEFPEKQAPITAEHLLKHQSGIRHYKGNEVRSAVSYDHVADALKIFRDDPLQFAPGEKFLYTTYGYNLLGAVIEAAAGQDYVGYVQEHVCRPAGMTSIRPDNPYQIIPHRAAGYRRAFTREGELRNDWMVDVSNKIPGGGWCSTAGDLARFAIALVDGRLVSKPTLERMWTIQNTSDGKPTRSGLGCFIAEKDGNRRISHSGGQPKVSTFLVFSPERRTAVAVMCNLQGSKPTLLANELMDLLEKPAAP